VKAPQLVGETTVTGKNQVSLPAAGLRRLRWKRGDHLLAEEIGDDLLVLMRRPDNWTEALAGKLTNVFGTHEETIRWLEEEREAWDQA
jgi:bifunctional DNA-binding transcriptional regulator/antitoxin component of YhaV-PrlF toxin-antitoxin module